MVISSSSAVVWGLGSFIGGLQDKEKKISVALFRTLSSAFCGKEKEGRESVNARNASGLEPKPIWCVETRYQSQKPDLFSPFLLGNAS